MTTKRVPGTLALATVVVLGACQGGAGPTTTSTSNDALLTNAAAVVADATLQDVTLATTPFAFGSQGSPALAGGISAGVAGFGGSFSGTRSVTFYDAAGNVQSAYDSLTTASIQVVTDLSRSLTRGDWSASVERTRDMTISGLEGEETTRTFNGVGTEVVSRSHTSSDGTQSSFDMNGSITYDNVVVPVPGSDPRWPLSGTITHTLTVNVVNGPNGDRTRTVTAVVTFNGTSTATAVVNGRTIQIDLTTKAGRFPFRGAFGR